VTVTRRPLPPVTAPALGVWGSHDTYITESRLQRSGDFVNGPSRYERIQNAGHWLPLDSPERINELLLEHLT
jgi:pimeloyl-ACP methyl ester carboxylesterase